MASDPVPANRLPFQGSWIGIVGVSNGIPNRQTVYTNFDATATAAQINTGIANCPSNQVVLLTNGTFTMSASLAIGVNGVTVRGAVDANGNPSTVLNFASSAFTTLQRTSQNWDYDNPAAFSNIGIGSGATRGSTSIVVTSTPTITPGVLMWITAPRNAPTIDGNPSSYFANWFPSTDNFPFSEVFKVTGVSGTTISFWPPLNADYISALPCIAHWRTPANQLTLSGLENLVLTNTTGFFNCDIIDMRGCDQCWVKNCFLYGVGQACNPNAGILFYTCFNCEVRHCLVTNAAVFGSSEYAIAPFQTSGLWIDDNGFTTLPNIMPMQAVSRSAFTFNCFTNEPYQSANFLSQLVFSHGAHDHYNLFEGNWIPTHFNDLTASGNFSHSRNHTYFRERLSGWDGNGPKTSNAHAITFQNHHDNMTVVGNIMGTSGTQTQYEQTTGGVGGNNSIFNYDSGVSGTTLVRYDNYNFVDNGIHSGEALTNGLALATSYIYASKPFEFGILKWPPVDPTVVNAASVVQTNIPAGFRMTFGFDPPQPGSNASMTVNGQMNVSGFMRVGQ